MMSRSLFRSPSALDAFAPLPPSQYQPGAADRQFDEAFGDGDERKKENANFWKPTREGEMFVGYLDAIESSTTRGDVAVFQIGCAFGSPIGDQPRKPLEFRPSEDGGSDLFRVGISANLKGRISKSDTGKWVRLIYTGRGMASGGNNAPKLFTVTVGGNSNAIIELMKAAQHNLENAE